MDEVGPLDIVAEGSRPFLVAADIRLPFASSSFLQVAAAAPDTVFQLAPLPASS